MGPWVMINAGWYKTNCRQIEPGSGSQAHFQCLCGGHLEEWLFRRDALGVTVWRRAKSPIIGQLAGWPFAFGVVCGLIRTAGAPNSPLRALSGRHRAAFQHDQAAHVVGEILHADPGGGAQDADSADELAAHAVMLVAEHMLDPRADL